MPTNDGLKSDERFTHYQPKDGDFIILDKPFGDKWVQHGGIAAELYNLIYAGAHDSKYGPPKHGIGNTDIFNFTGHQPYGSPSAVYRYKG